MLGSIKSSFTNILDSSVAKYNKKTVTVITEDSGRWNVSPSMLSKAEDVKQKKEESKNVIDFKKLK